MHSLAHARPTPAPSTGRRNPPRRRRHHPPATAAAALFQSWLSPPPAPPPCAEPALEAWLRGTAAGPGLRLACTVAPEPTGLRGLVATARLAPGAVAAAIPARALLSASAAAASSPAAAAAGAAAGGYAALMAALAEARVAAPGASPWSPYAASLPGEGATGCVLEWAPHQVAWLAGSPLAGVAAAARGEAEHLAATAVIPALVDRAGLSPAAAARAAAWAAAMLLTRLVRLGGGRGGPGAAPALDGDAGGVLVPWLDMANHAPGSVDGGGPCSIAWEEEGEGGRDGRGAGGAAVLRTPRSSPPLQPGTPVAASYGPDRPAGELLLAYGFVPPPGVETPGGGLVIAPAGDDPRAAAKAAALAARGAPPLSALLPLRPGRLPAGLVERAALLAAACKSDAEVGAAAARLLDGAAGGATAADLAAGARAAAAAAEAVLDAKKKAAGPPVEDASGLAVAVRDVLARERRALEGAAAELNAAARGWERRSRE